ncbi:hypothetical protein ALC60_07482, partial [Trachymyrmex zeteki]
NIQNFLQLRDNFALPLNNRLNLTVDLISNSPTSYGDRQEVVTTNLSQLAKDTRIFLRDLNDRVIFTSADKGSVTVALNRQVYISKVNEMLQDENTYEIIKMDPTRRIVTIFFALGIPLNIPDKSVAVSFYFEANYALPFELNSSYFYEGTYYAKRSLSRQLIYKVFTSKIDSFGYPGLDCLLRIICEAGKYSLNENGVLGDILQIIFTPSMSISEDLPDEIIEAESEQHCNQRYKKCPVNLLDLAS